LRARWAAAQAQATVGVDASLFSSYVWRGLTFTNKPVLEPDLYVTIPAGNASFTLGGWANLDLGKYDDAKTISAKAAACQPSTSRSLIPGPRSAIRSGKLR
jgi:hypothetical protein